MLMRHSGPRSSVLLKVGVLVGLEVLAGTLNGGRTAIALPILQLLLVVSLTLRPLPFRTLVVGYIGAFLVLAPLLTLYRQSYYDVLLSGRSPSFATVSAAIAGADERLDNGNFDWSAQRETILTDNATTVFRSTLRVLDVVPSHYDYAAGSTFVPSLATIAIPRIIWPDKPRYLPARDFAVKFWDVDVGEEFGTSIGIGMPAEAYYNFGWLGLAIFLPLGVFLRFCVERLKAYRTGNAVDVVRYFFVLFVIANIAPAILYYIGGGLRQLCMYILFASLITGSMPRLRKSAFSWRRVAS